MEEPILLSGSANRPLAKKVAEELGIKLGDVLLQKFSDGETYLNIREQLAGKQVFIIQSGSLPANENLMEMLLLIDAAWRLEPKKIVAVFPFLPYRRQERQMKPGEPISAQLVADLVETAGADKAIILDVHSRQILNFFDIPVTQISATEKIAIYFKGLIRDDSWVLVAPDQGSLWHTENAADVFAIPIVQILKERTKHDRVAQMQLVGEIKNKNVILIDDEVNTAGTLVEAVSLLKREGAANIYFGCTHGVLSGPAIDRLTNAPIKEIVVTDSIAQPKEKITKKIKIITVADILAEAIKQELVL
ncbi:ribose-phosphate pyrophosphokinase [Patescibacteria group bacterium]|nr:ribose-phosphate pyrophosphokinase [Patescibacteria group bacterium]